MNDAPSLSPEVLEFARRVESAKRDLAREAKEVAKPKSPRDVLKAQAYLAIEGPSPDLDAAARMVATMLSL